MNIDAMPVANAIELLTTYSPEIFDEVYKAQAYASRLSTDKRLLQFTGTKTVKIPKAAWGGLYDYNRPNVADGRVSGVLPYGYQASSVGLGWEEFTLTQDRAACWPIEHFDNEESGGVILGRSLTQLDRTVFVPEIDKYLFSKIYDYAGKKVDEPFQVVTSATTGLKSFLCLRALNDAFFYVTNQEVPEEEQILFVSTAFDRAMREDTAELPRWIKQEDYKKNISFVVSQYEGREVVVVVPQRFKTHFIPGPGHDIWGDGSKAIDFILMPKDAAIHVVKYNKTLILEGREALLFTHMDGYVILSRIYHDVFVLDNKRVAIYAHTGGFDAVSGETDANGASTYRGQLNNAQLAAGKLNVEITMVGDIVKRIVAVPADKVITLIKVHGDVDAEAPTEAADLVALTARARPEPVNVDSLVGADIGSKEVTITIPGVTNPITGTQVAVGDKLDRGDNLFAYFGGQFIAKITAIDGSAATYWDGAADETELAILTLAE